MAQPTSDAQPVRSLICNKSSWLMLVLGLLMVGALVQYSFVEGDTSALLANADGILGCLREGRLSGCAAAGFFPPFQLLLAVPLKWLGLSMNAVGLFLARLSILAYLGVLAVTWRMLRQRSRVVAGMAVLVLTSGLPLHYANRSFGEMVAAFFSVAFVASWLEGRTVLVGASALLAALTKETAFPFLSLLGVVCSVVCGPGAPGPRALWASQRARFLAMAAGIAVAILVSISLNLFRSGVAYNPAYLGFGPINPPLATQLRLFFALWFAPNGGLLFFWPLFVITFVSIPFAMRRYSWMAPLRLLAPFFGVALLLTLLTAFLAGWWAPFGWWAWGQRLTLPWLPASLLILCFAYSAELEKLALQLLRTPLRAALLTAIVIVLALPHVASIFRSAQIIHDTFAQRPECDEPAPSEAEVARYYRCIERLAWTEPSPLVRAYRLLPHPFVRIRALILSTLLALGGASLYRAARGTTQP